MLLKTSPDYSCFWYLIAIDFASFSSHTIFRDFFVFYFGKTISPSRPKCGATMKHRFWITESCSFWQGQKQCYLTSVVNVHVILLSVGAYKQCVFLDILCPPPQKQTNFSAKHKNTSWCAKLEIVESDIESLGGQVVLHAQLVGDETDHIVQTVVHDGLSYH